MAVAVKTGCKADRIFRLPNWHAQAKEIQKYSATVTAGSASSARSAKVRGDMVKRSSTSTACEIRLQIRDMYKKHHWQVAGPTFYQLHLLFDKHFEEQVEIVDTIAERIQLLGGVTVAMGGDVAEMTKVPRPPKGKEEVPVQISRLLEAHKIIIKSCLDISEAADDAGDQGTNDLVVSDVLRANELQSWFIGQHLVEMPLTIAE